MFEDLDHAFSQRRCESFEDEMRVGLADSATGGGRDVVAEEDVVEGEGGRGAVRKMGDGQSGRRAPMFVEDDQIAQSGGVGARHQVRQHEVAPVQPDGRGQEQPDLLRERAQSRAWGPRCGDEDPRVDDAAEVGVFVVDAEVGVLRFSGGAGCGCYGGGGGVGLGFVVFVVGAQGGVVRDGGIERLARCEGGFELGPLRGDFGVAEGEGAPVEVVAALTSLSAYHRGRYRGAFDGALCPVSDTKGKISVESNSEACRGKSRKYLVGSRSRVGLRNRDADCRYGRGCG